MYCASPTIHRNKGWPPFLNSLSVCLFSAKFSPFHLLARQFHFILFISNYEILDVNSIQSTQHYVITAVEPLHLDGLCINFLICCLYVKFYYSWSGPLKSWPQLVIIYNDPSGKRVASVFWILCLTAYSLQNFSPFHWLANIILFYSFQIIKYWLLIQFTPPGITS